MQQKNELFYQIALSLVPDIGGKRARSLMQRFGSSKAIFQAKQKELLKVEGIGPSAAQKILEQKSFVRAEQEMAFIQKYHIKALPYTHPDFPQRLRHCEDCPFLLYYRGKANLNSERVVGIVGTRKPTERGKRFCEQLIHDLEAYGVLVVSGLAYGIDITAHRKSVEVNLPTVGVVAHGLDMIYPQLHKKTAVAMVESGGVLTEFISQTPPLTQNFPMRNRIIAGMVDVLVVVETAAKGGSMISAQFANDYHKDVFAVPGRTEDSQSKGCNWLIKTHKASLLESAADIAYITRWKKGESKLAENAQAQLFVELSKEEKQVVELLKGKSSVHLDHIIYSTKISTSRVSVMLLELEFRGLVRALPGKHFCLN